VGFRSPLDGGLYISDGTTTTTVALTSSPTYSTLTNLPSLNNAGLMGFAAQLDAGGSGLFTSDGTTTKTFGLTEGTPYFAFGPPPVNSSGLMAFIAYYDTLAFGLYVSDGTTTTEVLNSTSTIFGYPLNGLTMNLDSFNDAGQIAFGYTLKNGGPAGIAVATPTPEPGSALLLLGGAALLGGRRRRV
jgi:hypothetical protein